MLNVKINLLKNTNDANNATDGDYYKKYNFLLTFSRHQYRTVTIATKSCTQDEKVPYYTSHILAEETVMKESKDLVKTSNGNMTCEISETAKEWGKAYCFSIISISM